MLENVLIAPDADSHLREQSRLSVIDQILIQCLCIDIKNNNPKHGLITEQMASYIQRILVCIWSVFECRHILQIGLCIVIPCY